MAEAADEQPSAHEVTSKFQVRIKTIRVLFQVLGAMVCLLFASQGIATFIHFKKAPDFWQACHWVANGILYILMGLGGCLLELRTLFAAVRRRFVSFAVNRLVVALVYIWIGGYAMTSPTQGNPAWDTVGKVTGILAWLVGIVDIFMACCHDRLEKVQDNSKAGAKQLSDDEAGSGEDQGPTNGHGNNEEGPASDRPSPAHQASPEDGNPFGDQPAEGNWATVGNKPFGAG